MTSLLRSTAALLLGFSLAACMPTATISHCRAPNYLTGYGALPEETLVNVVIEVPAGTNAKWEVSESGSSINRESRDGKPRVVQYLAYPGSYGMVPRTRLPRELGGDGDPLDVIVLGPSLERGSVVKARPIALLHLTDDGERDDKILAVQTTGPLSEVADLLALNAKYPGVSSIIETWFIRYKGKGKVHSRGMDGSAAALDVVREASRYFEDVLVTETGH